MKNCRVLLIDDDEYMLDIAVQLFSILGFNQVETLSKARKLVEDPVLLQKDIIFCDLNMPEFDGIEVLRYLSSKAYRGGIVLVSGVDTRVLASAQDLAKAQDLLVLGVLSKPFSIKNLSRIFETALHVIPSLDDSSYNLGQPLLDSSDPAHKKYHAFSAEDLAEGLGREEFVVFYQPKVDLHTGAFLSVEALARWKHPQYGLVPPFAFISLAENSGLIDQLSDQILKMALLQGGAWGMEGLALKMAVNLSIKNLKSLDFPERTVILASEAQLPLQNLVYEITESSLIEDRITCMEILTRLRLKGIGLSIDDFGTGYSSLEQLMHIPFLELKIDQSFVGGASENSAARAILDSSVSLARKLNMSVVAEGVETKADWDLVKKAGCDIAQGYFISPPLPAEAIIPWSKKWAQTRRELFLA